MTTVSFAPCELILKVGSNECDEISTAITSLLRTCSISEQSFYVIERQIQPTTYYGSFTSVSSSSSTVSIPSQSLSCVLLLTDDILKQQQLVRSSPSSAGKKISPAALPKSKYFFKSTHIWNFHHKIELLDEHKHALARQDYYELSHSLPLWSVSHIPHSRQPLVRFNIFTQHFDSMITFYTRLFQRKPDSSKPGFVLFILPTSPHTKVIYQFSIKYSPSIQPYSIAQSAYLKFRLPHLDHFLNEYTSKLFVLNKFEYYIYDPDGNLLHLHLHDLANVKANDELNYAKPTAHTNDSGIGDSSDPPTTQLFSSTAPQGYKPFHPTSNGGKPPTSLPPSADIDVQSHSSQSSHDSGRWSSISSNEVHTTNRTKRTAQQIAIAHHLARSPAVPSGRKHENHRVDAINNYRLQQQQRTVLPRVCSKRAEQAKASLYDSEPRLCSVPCVTNRYYSSLTDVQASDRLRSLAPYPIHLNTSQRTDRFQTIRDDEGDISYEVDSPRSPTATSPSPGYLHAFLLKKRQAQQRSVRPSTVQQLIAQFEQPNVMPIVRRPVSAPLAEQTLKPTKGILQRRSNGTVTPVPNKSLRKRSKSVTFECYSDEQQTSTSSTDDDDGMEHGIDPARSPRINIGITLDSRLRKTPALDMLRSTTMISNQLEPKQLERASSFRQSVLPVARF